MTFPTMKKFCAYCGSPLMPSAKFCSECGLSLEGEVTKKLIQETPDLIEPWEIKKPQRKSINTDYRVIRPSKKDTNYKALDTSYKVQREDQFLRWETEYKKGFAKPLILLMLKDQDDYAYALTKRINVITRGHINIATSNIYPIIKSLRDSSLIKESRLKGQKRVMYSLTDKGQEFLAQIKTSVKDFMEIFLELINRY
ncbi:MAG: helix-turn-helix transcriptional regulator [Promethearchaeota archaeon]